MEKVIKAEFKGGDIMGWKLQLVSSDGYVLAEEFTTKEEVTTKDLGELDWILADGDSLVLSRM